MASISKAAIYHHSCRRKLRHPSEGKAQAAARSLNKYYGSRRFEVYFCAGCKGWHVGRKQRREK